MPSTEDLILDRIRYVANAQGRENMADLVTASMAQAGIYEPRKCLLTACSTEEEEERRWRFLRGVKGGAGRSIAAARKVVEGQLSKGFGIKANWALIDQILDRQAQAS